MTTPSQLWTHCKRYHELTPENTYITPKGYRECRDCRRDRRRAAQGKPPLRATTARSNPYVRWWLDEFGFEAFAIARAFLLGGGDQLIGVDMREEAA